jgi:tetratricopeptide (TPR) repeat protein
MGWLRVGVTIAVVCVVASPRAARADIESELVKQGVAAYDALEFERAVETLNRALGESLTREERVVTFRTLGFAYAALGRADEARGAFARLLRLDGRAELDRSVAPRVRALFEEARAQVATGRDTAAGGAAVPALQPEVSPAHPVEGQAVSITVSHLGGLARSVHLFHRIRGEVSYAELQTTGQGDRFALTIPGSDVRAPALEYYVSALDEQNAALGRAGTLAEPLRVDVTAAKRPVHKRGWVWGVAGGVVAAGVVAVVLGVTLSRPDSKTADVMLIAPR